MGRPTKSTQALISNLRHEDRDIVDIVEWRHGVKRPTTKNVRFADDCKNDTIGHGGKEMKNASSLNKIYPRERVHGSKNNNSDGEHDVYRRDIKKVTFVDDSDNDSARNREKETKREIPLIKIDARQRENRSKNKKYKRDGRYERYVKSRKLSRGKYRRKTETTNRPLIDESCSQERRIGQRLGCNANLGVPTIAKCLYSNSERLSDYSIALERYSEWFFEWTPPELIQAKLQMIASKRNEIVLAWVTSVNFLLNFRPLEFKPQNVLMKEVSSQTDHEIIKLAGPTSKPTKINRFKVWLRKRLKLKFIVVQDFSNAVERSIEADKETDSIIEYQDNEYAQNWPNEEPSLYRIGVLGKPCTEKDRGGLVRPTSVDKAQTKSDIPESGKPMGSKVNYEDSKDNEILWPRKGRIAHSCQAIKQGPYMDETSLGLKRRREMHKPGERTIHGDVKAHPLTDTTLLLDIENTTATKSNIAPKDRTSHSHIMIDEDKDSCKNDTIPMKGDLSLADVDLISDGEMIASKDEIISSEVATKVSKLDDVRKKVLNMSHDFRNRARGLSSECGSSELMVGHLSCERCLHAALEERNDDDEKTQQQLNDHPATTSVRHRVFGKLSQSNKVHPSQNKVNLERFIREAKNQMANEQDLQDIIVFIDELLQKKCSRKMEVKSLLDREEEFTNRKKHPNAKLDPNYQMERYFREAVRKQFAHHNYFIADPAPRKPDPRGGCIGCQLLLSSEVYSGHGNISAHDRMGVI